MKPLFNLSIQELQNDQIVDWGYTECLKASSYRYFDEWIQKEKHGPLKYLADHRKDLREHLHKFYPEAKSLICFLFDYTKQKKALDKLNPTYKVASYTQGFDGKDYHYWIGEKLKKIGGVLSADIPSLEFKISLDIHPVLERDFAQQVGLGWFGKNSMLINREYGSFNLIGTLIFNQKLKLDQKEIETDHCGQCTRCLDACPTNAIEKDSRTLIAKRCISTYTIELFKEAEPPKGYPTQSNEVFGCDICQDVCPWNTKPLERSEEYIFRQDSIVHFFNRNKEDILKDLEAMSNNDFKKFFKHTSFQRVSKKGLIKNLNKY